MYFIWFFVLRKVVFIYFVRKESRKTSFFGVRIVC